MPVISISNNYLLSRLPNSGADIPNRPPPL